MAAEFAAGMPLALATDLIDDAAPDGHTSVVLPPLQIVHGTVTVVVETRLGGGTE